MAGVSSSLQPVGLARTLGTQWRNPLWAVQKSAEGIVVHCQSVRSIEALTRKGRNGQGSQDRNGWMKARRERASTLRHRPATSESSLSHRPVVNRCRRLWRTNGLVQMLVVWITNRSQPPGADPHARWCGGRDGQPSRLPDLSGVSTFHATLSRSIMPAQATTATIDAGEGGG